MSYDTKTAKALGLTIPVTAAAQPESSQAGNGRQIERRIRRRTDRSFENSKGQGLCTAGRAAATPGTFIQTAVESLSRCSAASVMSVRNCGH